METERFTIDNIRADQIFYVVLWAVYVPVWALYMRRYWLARHKKLIAVRIPQLSMIVHTAFLMFLTFSVTQFFWQTSCAAVMMVAGTFVSLVFGSVAVSAWALWFLHQITRDSMYRHSQMLERLKEEVQHAKTRKFGRKSVTFVKRTPILAYSWFLQHKHYVSTRVLRRIFIVDALIMPVSFAVSTIVFPEMWSAPLIDCPNAEVPTLIVTLLVVIHGLIAGFFSFAIRKHADGYFLKREFKMSFLLLLVTIPPAFVVSSLFPTFETEVFYLSQVFINIFAYGLFYLQIIRVLHIQGDPMWKSHSLETGSGDLPALSDVSRNAPSGGGTDQALLDVDVESAVTLEELDEQAKKLGSPDLEDFLTFPEFHETFKEFLKQEFAVENILFHEQVIKFRSVLKECSGRIELLSVLDSSFLRLHDQFIVRGAPLMINIGGRDRTNLTKIAKVAHERHNERSEMSTEEFLENEKTIDMKQYVTDLRKLVSRAHYTIMRTLHVGPLPRYLNTQAYKDARTRIKIRVNERELGLSSPKGVAKLAPFDSLAAKRGSVSAVVPGLRSETSSV